MNQKKCKTKIHTKQQAFSHKTYEFFKAYAKTYFGKCQKDSKLVYSEIKLISKSNTIQNHTIQIFRHHA